MVNKILRYIIDSIIIFSQLFCVGFLLIVLYYSFSYMLEAYNAIPTVLIRERLFFVGIMIAVAAGIMFFIELNIRQIGSTAKPYLKNK